VRLLSSASSLKRQLAIATLVVLTLLGVLVAGGASLLFERIQARVMESRIEADAERVLAAVRRGPDALYLDQTRLDAAYSRPLSGQYFVIHFNDTKWRSRSLWDSELPAVGTADAFVRAPGPGGQQLLLTTKEFYRFGQRFSITVASDYGPLVKEFRRGLYTFTVLWVAALGAALLAMNLWLGRALRPLAEARRQVAEIQAGTRQSLDDDAPIELAPLIRQVNALLAETHHALSRSRQAMGNLGHALKTPLAVLYTLVDREEIRANSELRDALLLQLQQLSQRVGRELGQTQGAAASGTREPFVASRDLPAVIDALRRAHHRNLRVELVLKDDERWPLERVDLLEVMGNLLDNAWKWANSHIQVKMETEPDNWLIQVDDDGPGIADPAQRQRALQRGLRLDESVAGQGLGLAIVRDVVEAYHGKLTLGHSVLGGLSVCIRLPRQRGLAKSGDPG